MNKIALLNDAFRKTLSGGKVFLTAGVNELPDMVKAAAIQEVATFDEFTEDNDPYDEHDFGGFKLCGRHFYWKIEYYDERCEFGSENPADPQKTTRVLTIMLASES
jgi:hypothetical protein